jgi:hypothetical protein
VRRTSAIVLLVLAVALVALTVGCGKAATQVDSSAPGLIKAIFDSQSDAKSAVCPFDAEVKVESDPSQLTEEDLLPMNMLQSGVKATGTFSFDYDHQLMDIDVTASMSGVSYNMGIRMIKQQMFMSILGQWYDVTPALEESSTDYKDIWKQRDQQAVQDALTRAGLDMQDWFGQVKLVGQETLDGTPVYHVTCAPDMQKIITDGLAILQNKEIMAIVDPTGQLAESLADSEDMPTGADLADLQAMIPQMFPLFSVDLWASSGDNIVRKLALDAKVVPPADTDSQGIKSVSVSMTMSYKDINKPVSIKAPDKVLPYSSFQQMFGDETDSLLSL